MKLTHRCGKNDLRKAPRVVGGGDDGSFMQRCECADRLHKLSRMRPQLISDSSGPAYGPGTRGARTTHTAAYRRAERRLGAGGGRAVIAVRDGNDLNGEIRALVASAWGAGYRGAGCASRGGS